MTQPDFVPAPAPSRFKRWLLEGSPEPDRLGFYEDEQSVQVHHQTHPWWKVMCLTGVDYFSTLGY